MADGELFQRALKLLGEASDHAVVVAGPDGRVRHTNRRARTLLGWEGPGAAAAQSLGTIPAAPNVRSRLARDAGPWELETTVEVRGRRVPVWISKRTMAGTRGPEGSLVLITDLTEVGADIVQRDRARQNDRAKTRSLHMVAHDMGGPMTILNGYMSLVMDGSLGVGELERYIPMLADQLTEMQRLVNVLVDTARLEEGVLELRLEQLELGSFVERLMTGMRPPETGHRLIVRRLLPEVHVVADPIRLDSIIRSIVTNAIKYSPEGATVTCTVGVGRAGGGSPVAEVAVADEGAGIDAEDLDRLFTRFGRVGDPATNPPGAGLGLFVARELARLHGGELDVDSEVGKGSRFTLRLPLAEAAS